MTGTKPEILTHPNIPKPLHGIAPRVIKGSEWWDVERKKCYEKAGQKCEACGTKRHDAWPNRWLEAHEEYQRTSAGLFEFKNLVCLCPACHKFIHSGLRSVLVSVGKMTEEMNDRIQDHGISVLAEAGLMKEWSERHGSNDCEWDGYRMVLNGEFYGPSSRSFRHWKAGEWKNWVPLPSKEPTYEEISGFSDY